MSGATKTSRGSWELTFDGGRASEAQALVIACGRWWSLRGFPSPAGPEGGRWGGARTGHWLGVKAHFAGVARRDVVEMYFFPGGYCGLSPVEDGVYNACCLVDQDLAREACGGSLADFAAWMCRTARHPPLAARLAGATQASPTATTAGLRLGRREPHHDSALLVGDAAGFLDPFTGAGISMALNGGRLAARALAEAGLASRTTPDGIAALEYRRHLQRASTRGYRLARVIRLLVSARAEVQEAAAMVLSRLGPWLTAETRWKAGA